MKLPGGIAIPQIFLLSRFWAYTHIHTHLACFSNHGVQDLNHVIIHMEFSHLNNHATSWSPELHALQSSVEMDDIISKLFYIGFNQKNWLYCIPECFIHLHTFQFMRKASKIVYQKYVNDFLVMKIRIIISCLSLYSAFMTRTTNLTSQIGLSEREKICSGII